MSEEKDEEKLFYEMIDELNFNKAYEVKKIKEIILTKYEKRINEEIIKRLKELKKEKEINYKKLLNDDILKARIMFKNDKE